MARLISVGGMNTSGLAVEGGGDTPADVVTHEELDEILVTVPMAHAPEVFTVTDPVVSTFALEKTPTFVSEVLILNGEAALYYLQAADYSVAGRNITIVNPTLTPGWRVKVMYSYAYGS